MAAMVGRTCRDATGRRCRGLPQTDRSVKRSHLEGRMFTYTLSGDVSDLGSSQSKYVVFLEACDAMCYVLILLIPNTTDSNCPVTHSKQWSG